MLPAGCGVVGRMRWPAGRPIDYDGLLKSLVALPLGDDRSPEQRLEEAARQAIAIAEHEYGTRVRLRATSPCPPCLRGLSPLPPPLYGS